MVCAGGMMTRCGHPSFSAWDDVAGRIEPWLYVLAGVPLVASAHRCFDRLDQGRRSTCAVYLSARLARRKVAYAGWRFATLSVRVARLQRGWWASDIPGHSRGGGRYRGGSGSGSESLGGGVGPA